MNSHTRREGIRASLGLASDALVQEVSQGRWSHIPNLGSTPIEEWKDILDELAKRCPGHPSEEYTTALRRSVLNNR
jgi:hypothetical protein